MSGHVTTRFDEIADAIREGRTADALGMIDDLGDWAVELEDEIHEWKRSMLASTAMMQAAANKATAAVRLLRSLRLAG